MNNDIPPPDPSWDYYIHYHKLLRAKSKLQDLIQWLAEINFATDELDALLDDDLVAIIKALENTRNYEVHTPDEPDRRSRRNSPARGVADRVQIIRL